MIGEAHFLYCGIDSEKSVIKIGITNSPHTREQSLPYDFKPIKMIFLLKLMPKHSDVCGILKSGANYISSICPERALYFWTDARPRAHHLEMFFIKKFADYAIHKSEWFAFSEDRLEYIRRRFIALSKTENTALMYAEFISGNGKV